MNEETSDKALDLGVWARALKEEGDRPAATVLHLPTGTIGTVAAIFEPGEWTSPLNGKPVAAFVIQLDTGDTLSLKSVEHWKVLEPAEKLFADTCLTAFKMTLQQLVQFAAASKIEAEVAADILAAILTRQTIALAPPKDGGL